jgi:phospholipase C
MMSRLVGVALLAALALSALVGCGGSYTPNASGGVPSYQHIFLIVMENSSYDDIIGSSDAPRINALATRYGLATNYWAVSHPSEPNYIALLGGDTFGVSDDNAYTVNALTAPNLATQLDAAGLTWKSYQQSLPAAGYTGTEYPSDSPLYASKHNPFMNFLGAWPAGQRQTVLDRVVPETQLARDLAGGYVPNFAFITPDLCHDMHGAPSCASDLKQTGDSFVGDTVGAIIASSAWRTGNTAIIVVWDENDGAVGLGAPPIATDGGQVPALVITNHGPHGAHDNTPYNHYALLLTIEEAFGLGCLRNSCAAMGNVGPMTPLFAVAG